MESTNKIAIVTLLLSVFLATTVNISKAQTFGEYFNQNKTQKKYLLEQIAALQIYIGYAKQGYNIASTGLQTITDITNGEFGLHTAYITSLKSVSPVIRNHVKVAEIIETQINIKKVFGAIKSSELLTIANQLYIINIRDHIISECGKDLDELILVITSGKVEMSDVERIRRLASIYESISDKYAFTMDFVGEVMMLIEHREKEQDFFNRIKKNYEIN